MSQSRTYIADRRDRQSEGIEEVKPETHIHEKSYNKYKDIDDSICQNR